MARAAEKVKAQGKPATPKQAKKEARAPRAEAQQKKEPEPRSNKMTLAMIAVVILVLIALFVVFVLPTLNVSFSTFKSNFQHSGRVAVFAVYKDQSGSGIVLECAAQVVQVAAHSRNATTIDFYVLNQTKCTYPIGGLGHQVSLATNTIANCLSMAGSETSLFLNYSAANRTIVTPYKLYVYGNAQYMSSCPIAVDLS